MRSKSATLLLLLVGASFLLTAVTSKPVSLNTAADESDSVEANSSEEAVNEEEVEEVEGPELPEAAATEPALAVTEAPNVVMQTDPPATIALPVAADATALPSDAIDPQTSTDGLQMLPEDPLQAPVGGAEVSQDMPETDPALDPLAAGAEVAAGVDVGADVGADAGAEVAVEVGVAADLPQQQTNGVQQEAPLPVATLHPPYVSGKSAQVSVVHAVPVHVTEPGLPVCFTFHTPQQPQRYVSQLHPPRGDSY